MKIIFNVTDNGAWAEIEQPDGTMKKWNEDLTDLEYAQISAAGMMLEKGSMMRALFPTFFTSDSTPKLLTQIEKHLNIAEKLLRRLYNIK